MSIDPKEMEYPDLSPYCFAGNSPIWFMDKHGLEPDRNSAGTIEEASQQWATLTNPSVKDILNYISSNPNAVRFIYTEQRGWIDLQHYFGTLVYGKFAMDLLEPASGSWLLQNMGVFNEDSGKSYYSYEDLPSNQFASEGRHHSYVTNYVMFYPLTTKSFKMREELINSVVSQFNEAGATAPESAPNWKQLPFKDHTRERLPEIKGYETTVTYEHEGFGYVPISQTKTIYYSEKEKQSFLQTGNYVPQNHSSAQYNLEGFPAAATSIEKGDTRKGATGH